MIYLRRQTISNTQAQGLSTSTRSEKKKTFLLNHIKISTVSIKKTQNEENSMVRKVKVVMVDQPTFKPKHDEGLLEPLEKLANLSPWTRTKEMQPLLNAVEIQRHAKEEPPKLILNPLPPQMKYAYRVEDKLKQDQFFLWTQSF